MLKMKLKGRQLIGGGLSFADAPPLACRCIDLQSNCTMNIKKKQKKKRVQEFSSFTEINVAIPHSDREDF